MRVDLRSIAEAAAIDPKRALLDRVGPDIDRVDVLHNLILVATYIPSDKIGSIIMPDRSLAEARFQGKIGLVLRLGPLAFHDDSLARFGGVVIKPGEWIYYRPSDANEFFFKDCIGASNDGVACRLVEDTLVKMRVPDPSWIY